MEIKNRLGYCCINTELSRSGVTTNRGMIQKTFMEKGLVYVSEIALKNLDSLIKILKWNQENRIKMFRMSSDMLPWCSEYEIKDLPNYDKIVEKFNEAGQIAKESGQRLSFHPSHYTILASTNDNVVKNAIKELRQHAEIMDMMGLDRSTYYPINIHIGTAKPSKEEAAARFCQNFKDLDDSVKSRLVVENDDKMSGFTPKDLYDLIYRNIGIPITFDYHHYSLNPDHGVSEECSLKMAVATWTTKALTHYSDSRKIYEDITCKDVAHSDWIWNKKIPTYDLEFDIELEVKMKEQALLKYRDNISEDAGRNTEAQGL